MTSKSWKQLTTGDRIACPADGQTERVVSNRPYTSATRVIRTSRHDHYPKSNERVQLVSEGKSCAGAGEGYRNAARGGGARWVTQRGICRVCGKSLALTSSGRIPRHVPKS
jgi:hypothetical protein